MGTGLKGLIQKKKSEIIQNWFEATIQTYAPDTAQFYKGQKDQFGNPVGSVTAKGIAFLLDQLLDTWNREAVKLSGSVPSRVLPLLKPPDSFSY